MYGRMDIHNVGDDHERAWRAHITEVHADCIFSCKPSRGDAACLNVPEYRNRSATGTFVLPGDVFRVFQS